jgi:hypothetical protein
MIILDEYKQANTDTIVRTEPGNVHTILKHPVQTKEWNNYICMQQFLKIVMTLKLSSKSLGK